MKNFIIPLLLLASASIAQGQSASEWQNMVVKTRSFPCETRNPIFEGSGVLIETSSGTRVVTSEHVLIQNSTETICHEIESASLGLVEVSAERVSYLQGLALLKPVSGTFARTGFSSTQMAALNRNGIRSVMAIGVPRGSTSLQVLASGKVLSLESKRALIPGVSVMGEFSGLPVEYGMSGGLLIAEASNGAFQFLGIISHQVLRRGEGVETKVVDVTSSSRTDATDLLLGILNADVRQWIGSQATVSDSGVTADADVWQRSMEQDGSESIQAGPFKLIIGGFDSSNIYSGGADGSGVGGDGEVVKKNGNRKAITISLSSRSLKEAEQLMKRYPFFRKWQQPLLQGKKISIVQVSKRLQNGRYDVQGVSSLDKVLTLWLKEGYEPIIFVGDLKSVDQVLQKRMSQASQVLARSAELQKKLAADPAQAAALKWLRVLDADVSNFANSSAPVASVSGYANSAKWDELYVEHLDETVALVEALKVLVR